VLIIKASKVILLDAVAIGSKSGTIHRLGLDKLEAAEKRREISLHDIYLMEALRIARWHEKSFG